MPIGRHPFKDLRTRPASSIRRRKARKLPFSICRCHVGTREGPRSLLPLPGTRMRSRWSTIGSIHFITQESARWFSEKRRDFKVMASGTHSPALPCPVCARVSTHKRACYARMVDLPGGVNRIVLAEHFSAMCSRCLLPSRHGTCGRGGPTGGMFLASGNSACRLGPCSFELLDTLGALRSSLVVLQRPLLAM